MKGQNGVTDDPKLEGDALLLQDVADYTRLLPEVERGFGRLRSVQQWKEPLREYFDRFSGNDLLVATEMQKPEFNQRYERFKRLIEMSEQENKYLCGLLDQIGLAQANLLLSPKFAKHYIWGEVVVADALMLPTLDGPLSVDLRAIHPRPAESVEDNGEIYAELPARINALV